ncbi:hypothetical protein P3T76_010502 [Phytophthora citrophthora]|uniref:Uncharacterized protein n=1 Tax=Phytophthora citrophthora TaxID=4793 RepID=A0AAD9GC19_9STRA|nr:hypothetical protein P3T76_010502 [Phytophthora citrophthora]
MQAPDWTRNIDLVEMGMTLSLIDCWKDFGTKFDMDDVGDSPPSVTEAFNVVENSERGAISPAARSETRALPVKQKDQSATGIKRRRRTPKQEIERLRLLERNLKLQFETLQLQVHMHMYMQPQDHSIYPHISDALSFWKSIASRQYAQRIHSERENLRLKKVVKARIAHAKRLKR